MQEEQPQSHKEEINLNYMGECSSSECGYCKTNGSYTSGFIKKIMLPYTYQLLIERGWRRCGEYYYKPDIQRSCCKLWTHRMDTTKFKIKKDQRKTMKKFMKLINPSYIQSEPQKKLEKSAKKQLSMQQQLTEQEKNIIHEIVKILHGAILDRREEFVNLFRHKLEKQSDIDNFRIEGALEKLRLFCSKPTDKYDAFCNYFMVCFGSNKKIFKKEYKSSDFMGDVGGWVEATYEEQGKVKNTSIKLDKSGYLMLDFGYQKPKNSKISGQQPEKQTKQTPKTQSNPTTQPNNKVQFKITYDQITLGNLTIKIQKAEVNETNWGIYKRYCSEIHQKNQKSKSSFKNFLCLQSLKYEEETTQQHCDQQFIPTWDQTLQRSTPNGQRKKLLGCYHMNYYIKEQLIAVGVIDTVRSGLSSVYFFYEPKYKDYRLGVVSSIIEIQYLRWSTLSFPDFKNYYMGFYIKNCQKMSYKADYEPCELLCPVTYTFVEITPQLRQLLDKIDKKQVQSVRLSGENVQINPDMMMPQNIQNYIKGTFKLKHMNQILSLNQLNPGYSAIFMKILKQYVSIWGKQLYSSFYFSLQ